MSATSGPNANASQNAATHTSSDMTSETKPRQMPISAEMPRIASSTISAQVSMAIGAADQGCGTMLPSAPSLVLALALSFSASARRSSGPSRTRHSVPLSVRVRST